MITVTVVEPHALIRLGIQQLLEKLDPNIVCVGIDYDGLHQNDLHDQATDLMLLSVPTVYSEMLQLVDAARNSHNPTRILLLSDAQTLPYSLLNLPSNLAGYISKHSSPHALVSAVSLVLAGGTCFPAPDHTPAPDGEPDEAFLMQRRWYDHQSIPAQHIQMPEVANPLAPITSFQSTPAAAQASQPPPASPVTRPVILPPELVSQESRLLNVTPRQYEVLVLLARGYPLKKVSRELNISLATAKTHTEALYQRLSVNNRNAAVYSAITKGATLGWYEADSKQSPATQDLPTAPFSGAAQSHGSSAKEHDA